MAVGHNGLHLFGDFPGGHPGPDALPGLKHLQGNARGQAAAVNGEHVARQLRLLGGQLAVFLGAGKGPAQAEVDHVAAGLHKGAEVVRVLPHVDGRCLGQGFPVVIGLVNLLHMDVHVVLVLLALQDDVEGVVVHVVPGLELLAQVAGAVGAENHVSVVHLATSSLFSRGEFPKDFL